MPDMPQVVRGGKGESVEETIAKLQEKYGMDRIRTISGDEFAAQQNAEAMEYNGWMVNTMAWVMIAAGVCSFVALVFFKTAEYGRYSQAGKKKRANSSGGGGAEGKPEGEKSNVDNTIYVPAKFGWFIQEAPAFFVPLFNLGEALLGQTDSTPNMILLSMFMFHYANRTFVFPMRLRGGKPSPLHIVASAFGFCLFNGFLQSRQLTHAHLYEEAWLWDPRFLAGFALFVLGMYANWRSDNILLNLRKPGETGYKIPKGFMFEYVSGANFFGEIVEWTGFAIASWSLPAAAFALFTFCNTAPRGAAHHQWYLKKFKNYPASRKAVIPFIW